MLLKCLCVSINLPRVPVTRKTETFSSRLRCYNLNKNIDWINTLATNHSWVFCDRCFLCPHLPSAMVCLRHWGVCGGEQRLWLHPTLSSWRGWGQLSWVHSATTETPYIDFIPTGIFFMKALSSISLQGPQSFSVRVTIIPTTTVWPRIYTH